MTVTHSPSHFPSDLTQYVDQMSQVLGLPIPDEYRQGVIENVARTAAIAQLVLDFPLPPEVEAAPIFQPAPAHSHSSHA